MQQSGQGSFSPQGDPDCIVLFDEMTITRQNITHPATDTVKVCSAYDYYLSEGITINAHDIIFDCDGAYLRTSSQVLITVAPNGLSDGYYNKEL